MRCHLPGFGPGLLCLWDSCNAGHYLSACQKMLIEKLNISGKNKERYQKYILKES